jgi:hypothetical protein
LAEETAVLIETKGYLSYLPELLRVKAGILWTMPEPRMDDAETSLKQSLELSHKQGALAWQLRTATDLACFWARQGHLTDAQELLQPILEKFSEGADTADIKAAKGMLARWSSF